MTQRLAAQCVCRPTTQRRDRTDVEAISGRTELSGRSVILSSFEEIRRSTQVLARRRPKQLITISAVQDQLEGRKVAIVHTQVIGFARTMLARGFRAALSLRQVGQAGVKVQAG
jgi:hypothetical protein